MKRALLASFFRTGLVLAPCAGLSLSGCLTSDAPADGGADMAGTAALDFSGGTYAVPGCGYSVATREGATAPAPGPAMFGSDPTPKHVHLGIAGDASTSMVLEWRTKDDTTLATTAQWGTGGQTSQSTDGVTFAYQVLNGNAPNVQIHQVHLCGLTPATTYSYRVGGKDGTGKEAWSSVYTFHTAPAPTDATAAVTVAVIGDTRDNYSEWGTNIKNVQTLMPDLILFNGDAVLLGQTQSDWETWFDNADSVLPYVPLVSAHGNHDNNSINFFSQLAMPGNEENFGFDYGPIHVTVLNDSPQNTQDLSTVIASALDADLTKADARPWKFLMHHQPMYSSCAGHGSNMTLRAAWGPIVDKHKVDMVFNGHDHDYERTKPMRNNQAGQTPADGTIYVVAGSAGAPLYDKGNDPSFTSTSVSTYNFALLKIRVGNLDFKAYDDKLNVLDSMTITK